MTTKHKSRLGGNALPFCAGIACGIAISVLLFLLFASPALFGQFWFKTTQNIALHVGSVGNKQHDSLLADLGDGIMKRRLTQNTGDGEMEAVANKSIPIEVDPEPIPVEDSAWEKNLSPAHIPGYLSQELKLKKKVFVGLVHPSIGIFSLLDLHQKTWAKDWVMQGNGDMTIYVPLGLQVTTAESINVYHMTAQPSQRQDEPSVAMIYQVLNDICNQHIDSHHHFFVVGSNTYVHLPRLLNFTNHLDDSMRLYLGNKVANDESERSFSNDPEFHCGIGPGFILTRHALQHLCPRLIVCQRDHVSYNVPTGLQLSRCVLRFLNQTCKSAGQHLFHQTNDNELEAINENDSPFKESISIHPVDSEVTENKLHYYFLSQQLNETKKRNEYYHNIIQSMDRVLVQEGGMADDRLILGRNGNDNKYQHGDIISWDKIEFDGNHEKVLVADGAEPSSDLTESDKISLDKVKTFALREVKKEYGWITDLTIKTIFRRVVPGVGFQYMVDIDWDNKEVATVYIDQPYDRMRPLGTQLAPSIKVNFILPMQDGSPHFKEFMQMFEQACMSADRAGDVSLLVVLYFPSSGNEPERNEKSSESLKLLNLYKQKYPDLSLRWINGGSNAFSYIDGVGMAIRALPAETLLCSTDLYVQMSPEFLHHARLNTIPGERLYFPASFQQFQTENGEVQEISRQTGFWRSFDHNIFCGYKQDIMRACGGENFASGADLYERALASGLDVFRAPEHALSMKWSERNCQSDLLSKTEQTSCEETSKNIHMHTSVLR